MRSKNCILFSFILFLISCTPTYMVIFSAGEGGAVSNEGGEFEEGSVVTVQAIPNEHYEFEQWSDGSTKSSLTIGVVEAISLTAYFKKN